MAGLSKALTYTALAGVPALTLGGYGAYRNLISPYMEGERIKKKFKSDLPKYLLGTLGATVAAGTAGYGLGKARHGMAGYVPPAEDLKGKLNNLRHIMGGRTGLEGEGIEQTVTDARNRLTEAAGRSGVPLHMFGRNVRIPAPESDYRINGSDAPVRGRDLIGPGSHGMIKMSSADNAVRDLIFKVAEDKTAALYTEIILSQDKKASALGYTAAGLGGLAVGGAGLYGTKRYYDNKVKSKLDMARRFAGPGAAVIGSLLGGAGGYLLGRESGMKQKDAAFDDMLEINALDSLTAAHSKMDRLMTR